MGAKKTTKVAVLETELAFECNWDVGIGGSLWTNGLLLVDYLSRNHSLPEIRNLLLNKTIVELGSGTGLVGLACALFNPKQVFLTDLASHLQIMQTNLKLNQSILHTIPSNVDVHVQELAWGEKIEKGSPLDEKKIDLIVGTDVAYQVELYEPLLATLNELSSESTVIILGMNRSDTDLMFFNRLTEEGYSYYKIPDHFVGQEYKEKDCGLFEIRKL